MTRLGRMTMDGTNNGLTLVFVGLALMNFVPGPEPGTVIFMLGACWTSARYFCTPSTGSTNCAPVQAKPLALVLLVVLTLSAVIGLVAGHPLPSIAKSAVPFIVLAWTLVVLLPQFSSPEQIQRLLIFAASLWAIRLIWVGTLDYLSGTSLNWLRLTLVNADAVVPFPLIVIPLLLFSSLPMSRTTRVVALTLQLVIVAWSGYRSQQLLVGVMLTLALAQLAWARPLFAGGILIALISTVGTIGYLASQSNDASLLTAQFDRYTTLNEERETSGRVLERRFALDRFLNYPVMGGGLGVQVPASITYASTEISDDYELPETVSYLHNGPLYLLMSGGPLFLLAYLSIWIAAFVTTSCLWVRVALLSLFAFIQVEATFLQVHFNVLLAVLMARPPLPPSTVPSSQSALQPCR